MTVKILVNIFLKAILTVPSFSAGMYIIRGVSALTAGAWPPSADRGTRGAPLLTRIINPC